MLTVLRISQSIYGDIKTHEQSQKFPFLITKLWIFSQKYKKRNLMTSKAFELWTQNREILLPQTHTPNPSYYLSLTFFTQK